MMNLNTRYSRKGVSEITSANDNTYLKFATKNRVGYIVLDESTGKFSITPGAEGAAAWTSLQSKGWNVLTE